MSRMSDGRPQHHDPATGSEGHVPQADDQAHDGEVGGVPDALAALADSARSAGDGMVQIRLSALLTLLAGHRRTPPTPFQQRKEQGGGEKEAPDPADFDMGMKPMGRRRNRGDGEE